ncbi:hypothetical protein TruAng_005042 [Truncatella angustata]|nr:hypothetical protein TruAng_005042 [Truncatella angustata]
MEAGLTAYRSRFDAIKTKLVREVSQSLDLTQELLEKLSYTETALKQTELDLDNEREARRRLQEEVKANSEWKEQQERRPFIVAVIDADADDYVFRYEYIGQGEKGGENAADALLAAMQQYVRELVGVPNNVDILVRAFADVRKLGKALVRGGRLQNAEQLKEFAAGFSNRQALFDFIDIGTGKERADHKIRACGHDKGYAPFLGDLVSDQQVAQRITLLEGSPFPKVIQDLGLKKVRFSSVFNKAMLPTVRPRMSGQSWSGVMTANRSIGAEPGVPLGPMMPFTGYHNPRAKSSRLVPISKGENGRRLDRPLQIDDATVERIKKGALCYYLYLRGECVSGKCRRNHTFRQDLSDDEFDALWSLARKHGWCYESQKADSDCSDEMCVYRHTDHE